MMVNKRPKHVVLMNLWRHLAS